MSAETITAPGARPLHRLLTTFGGVPAGQFWADYYLWELVLNAHRDVAAIVEVGTWQGGFSRYLDVQARMRGIAFSTFDVVAPADPPPGFSRVDVFANPEAVIDAIQAYDPAPVVLLCDGGNKPREAATFAPALPAGSVLVVHDWLTEFHPGDVPGDVTPIYEDVCDALGSMSRVFVKSPTERTHP